MSNNTQTQRRVSTGYAPVVTQRAVHMKASAWEAVQRLCNSYDTSISKMIEILVLDADAIHTSQED